MPGIWLADPGALHLERTLASGQTFRWRWDTSADGGRTALGVVGRHVLRLRHDDRGLWLLSPYTAAARRLLIRYLGLARPGGGIPAVEAALAGDVVLAGVLAHTRGIAVLAQDPWEILISFIISANNNIPKISRSIERLARALGERLNGGAWAFPSPERVAAAHARTLAACLLGYRAPYVRAAARLVADGRLNLADLQEMSLDDARDRLLSVPGVGEKVADCMLLFGLGHTGAFPVDIWVQRAVERLYFRGRPRLLRQIRQFGRARFGPLAGYAQQHLFTYARSYLRGGPALGRAGNPPPVPRPALDRSDQRLIAANAWSQASKVRSTSASVCARER